MHARFLSDDYPKLLESSQENVGKPQVTSPFSMPIGEWLHPRVQQAFADPLRILRFPYLYLPQRVPRQSGLARDFSQRQAIPKIQSSDLR